MSEENDWIFDFVLQFLGSDRFDAAVMDFVDENCHIFENDEENKFIYTDIYQEFLDHMEGVINSNLAELDVTPDVFYEACQTSRNSRDINKRVFEKLLAMEDFSVFKKIMVKRNTELQFEAMQAYKEYAGLSLGQNNEDELAMLPNPEELEQMLDDKEGELEEGEFDADKVETIYRESLLELEMIHKQEELEQLELEQALAMSLMAEEERLKQARMEVKNSPDDDEVEEHESVTVTARHEEQAEAKRSSSPTLNYVGASKSGDEDAKRDAKQPTPSKAKLRPTETVCEHTYADPKPLKMGGLGSPMKALPSISKAKKIENLTEMNKSYNEKKKKTEQAFSKNSRQLYDSKQKQDELTKGISVAEEEARKRSEYMKAQRDKLVAAKKRERDEKVQEEDSRLGRKQQAPVSAREESKEAPVLSAKEEEQEEQRAAMRMALARRMKQSLVESEEARLSEQYDTQYSALDSKLLEVERLRTENQMREGILAENLRRQQAAIARNVQRSAAQLRQEDNKIR